MEFLYSVNNQPPSKYLPSIRSLLVASFILYKRHFWDLLPLLVVWTSPLILGFFSNHFIYQIFLLVLSIIAGFWFPAALIYSVHIYANTTRQKEDTLTLWKKSLYFILPFIWLSILTYAIFFGIIIALFVPMALIGVLLTLAEISTLLQFLLLLPLFAVPVIILTILFIFGRYTLIIENQTGLTALLRSRQLVKGYWWGIFLRTVFLFLLTLPLVVLYFLLFYLFPPTQALFEQLHFKILNLVPTVLFIFIFSFTTIFQYLLFRFLVNQKPLETFNPKEGRRFYRGLAILSTSVIIYAFLIIIALLTFGFLIMALD